MDLVKATLQYLGEAPVDEMKGATSGRRQSRTFPLSKQREADAFAKKHGGEVEKKGKTLYVTYDLPEGVELEESPEDKEPASPDELSMATKQLEFIEHASRKVNEHLNKGGAFPEWMQNKLANVKDDMGSLYSYMDRDVQEEVLGENHFKHGESVKCIASGMEGEVIDVGNPEEDEKYYTVRRNDGQVMKYAPDELESLEEINESKMPSEKEINKAIAKTKTMSQAVDILMKKFKMSKDEAELIMQSMTEEGGAGEEGTDELTKKYKKDTPMEEVVVEKTAEQAGAFEDGKKAARKGKKYEDNPHKKGTDLHLWWSKGHNKVRESVMAMSSKKKSKKESKGLDARTRTFKEKLKKLGYKKTVKEDIQDLLDEMKDTNFDSYSSAIRHALDSAEKQGYEVDENDVFREITTGRGKPGRGKTVRHTLKLTKGGKPQRKALHIQVYNRETPKKPFELNFYIS